MRVAIALLLTLPLLASLAQASHLSEEEVLAMEKTCQDLREAKLAPERAALIQQCVREGEGDSAGCTKMYSTYGEYQPGAIRKVGKYNDLPECQEAYRARKHFHVNPGR
jgi:hypothetical protein